MILFNKFYTFIFFIKESIFSGSKVTPTIVSSSIKQHTAIENSWSLSVANRSFVNDAVIQSMYFVGFAADILEFRWCRHHFALSDFLNSLMVLGSVFELSLGILFGK